MTNQAAIETFCEAIGLTPDNAPWAWAPRYASYDDEIYPGGFRSAEEMCAAHYRDGHVCIAPDPLDPVQGRVYSQYLLDTLCKDYELDATFRGDWEITWYADEGLVGCEDAADRLHLVLIEVAERVGVLPEDWRGA